MMPSTFEFRSSWSMVTLSYISLVILYINIFSIPPITLILIKDIRINHFQVGLLMTVYTVFYCGFNVFTGILSDKFGPKIIMTSGLLLAFLSSLIFTYTSNFNMMLISRVLTGFGAASMTSPCIIYILSRLPPQKRGLGVSGHLASLTLGSGIVFLMTPILTRLFPWRLLLQIYALLGFIILFLFFIFGKDLPQKTSLSYPIERESKAGILNPAIMLLSIILFITLFQIGGTLTWLAPWLEERCMLSPIKVGLGSMTFALVGIPSAMFGGYIFSKYMSGKIQNIVYLSSVGMLISTSTGAFVGLEGMRYFPLILVAIILARWGSFMSMGPLLSIVPKLVNPNSRGLAIGFVNSIAMSGGFLSSLLGGYIIEHTGQYQLLWIVISVSLLFSAFVLHPLFYKKMMGIQMGESFNEN